MPVLPVSVWWEEEKQRWQVVFGPPINWSADSRLHDLQVGLEIAYALPPEEAPEWQKALKDWELAAEAAEDKDKDKDKDKEGPDDASEAGENAALPDKNEVAIPN